MVSKGMQTRSLLLLGLALLAACDDKKTDTATPAPSATETPAAPTASAPPKPKATIEMPPRPVPKPQTTVGAGESQETQMKAIGYMNAMVQPRPDDPIVDDAWVKSFIETLKPIVRGLDKGTPEAKARLNKVEMVAGGRKLDLLMASGCDDQVPTRAAQAGSAPLDVLYQHGVLVVRCNDSRVQCLQSTREKDDLLCTTAPRH